MTKSHSRPSTGRMRHLVFGVLIILGIFPIPGFGSPQNPNLLNSGLATIQVPRGDILYAEIADTPRKRRKGLMFRRSLAPDHGMLFRFSDMGSWTFWMKNTQIPLDIIWLDQSGKVVDMAHNVPICERTDDFCPRYTPRAKAIHVLEVRAGTAKKLGLKRGDHLVISWPY